MGCAASIYKVGGNKKPMNIPLVTIFTPSLRIPISSSFNKPLKGLVPNDLIDRLTYSRNQVTLLANQTGVPELLRALEGYLSLLVGLTDQELGFRELVEFKWRTLDDGGQEICVADSWFELLSVVHMMAILTLIQANSKLIPDQTDSSETVESTDKIRCAVDLLVKAAGYLQFCLREILVKIPQDIKAMVQRLQGMEQRQQQMMSFLAKAVNSPGFLAQFVQQQNESTRLITEGNKKPRYKEDGVISNSNEHSSDGRIVRYQPAMNDAAQAMLKQLMKLDNSSSRLNTFTSGVTLQEVAPPASGQSYSSRGRSDRMELPLDVQENVIEAAYIQALGQGTEMQLASAVESKNATLSVKRRLACEQLSYFSQAHYCLSTYDNINGYGKKHLSFLKWKHLEAKAAAYYYHGLIIDKGTEPSCHISAVCCFLAAEEILTESKKACLNFCLTVPITRAPAAWGAMKHLNKKIPEIAAKKSQMYAYLLEEEKSLEVLPELPEFELSLKAEEYEMADKDGAWDSENWKIPNQTLKMHLTDDEEDD